MDELDDALSPQTVALLEALISSSIEAGAAHPGLRQLLQYLCGLLSPAETQRVTEALTSSHSLRMEAISIRRLLDTIQGRPVEELVALRSQGEAVALVIDTWLEVLGSQVREAARWWLAAEVLRRLSKTSRHATFRDGESSPIEASIDDEGTLHVSAPASTDEQIGIYFGEEFLGLAQVSGGRARLTLEGFGAATRQEPGELPSAHFHLGAPPSAEVSFVAQDNAEGAPIAEANGEPTVEAGRLRIPIRLNGNQQDAGKRIAFKAVVAPGEAQLLQELTMPAESRQEVLTMPALSATTFLLFAYFDNPSS